MTGLCANTFPEIAPLQQSGARLRAPDRTRVRIRRALVEHHLVHLPYSRLPWQPLWSHVSCRVNVRVEAHSHSFEASSKRLDEIWWEEGGERNAEHWGRRWPVVESVLAMGPWRDGEFAFEGMSIGAGREAFQQPVTWADNEGCIMMGNQYTFRILVHGLTFAEDSSGLLDGSSANALVVKFDSCCGRLLRERREEGGDVRSEIVGDRSSGRVHKCEALVGIRYAEVVVLLQGCCMKSLESY